MSKVKLRVMVIDSQESFRQATKALLSTWSELALVGEADNAETAMAQCDALRPDIVLIEIKIPLTPEASKSSSELGGLDVIRQIKAQEPETRVLVFTMYGNLSELALTAGADAFLLKGETPAHLAETMETIVQERRSTSI